MQSKSLNARFATCLAVALLFMLATGPLAMAQRRAITQTMSGVQTGARNMSQSAPKPNGLAVGNRNPAVKYKVVQIGVLPGKTNSFLPDAKSVNNLGHAAGYSYFYTRNIYDVFRAAQAFIWQDGKLKALPLLKGWTGAFGFAINDRDQVVGTANNVDPDNTIHQTPVMWDHGQPINLGTLFPGANSSPLGVNNLGVVVGGSAIEGTDTNAPWVWYGGSLHALPFLPGMNHGFAESINDFGVIVGRQGPPDESSSLPCLWYWNGSGYTPISLGSFGGDYGDAIGNNNLGQAVGYSLYPGDIHGPAFVWDFRGLHALPSLPGDTDGQGNQINDLGQIVGFSQLFDDQGDFISERVVSWQNGIPTELQTVVPPGTPTLTDVGNANLFGQISVGSQSNLDGHTVAYILTPTDH